MDEEVEGLEMPIVGREHADIVLSTFLDATDGNSNARVRQAAKVLDVHPSTFRRWIQAGKVPTGERAGFSAEKRDIEAFYEMHGSAAAAWRIRVRECNGDFVSYETFNRALRRHLSPEQQTVAREGPKGAGKHRIYWTVKYEKKTELLCIDAKQWDILVRPRNSRHKPQYPWVVTAYWAASRAIGGYSISFHKSTQHNVLEAIFQAIVGSPDRGPFQGIPEAIRCDNGSEITSKHVAYACAVLQALPLVSKRRTPHLNGALERTHSTYDQEFQIGLPHNRLGPKAEDGTPLGPRDLYLTFDELVRRYHDYVIYFNTKRKQKPLGKITPAEWWSRHPCPIRLIDRAHARRLLQLHKRAKVQKDGVHMGGLIYYGPAIAGMGGRIVDIYFGEDRRQVEIYYENEWLGTVKAKNLATAEEVLEVAELEDQEAELWKKELAKNKRRQRAELTSLQGPDASEDRTAVPSDQVQRRLKELRTRKGMSNDAAARLLGLDDDLG